MRRVTTDITELAQREKFEAWFVNDVVGAVLLAAAGIKMEVE